MKKQRIIALFIASILIIYMGAAILPVVKAKQSICVTIENGYSSPLKLEVITIERAKPNFSEIVKKFKNNKNTISYEEIKESVKKNEYPVAYQIWKYLKEDIGLNDYVCAGIMGNLMTECGGQTLNLNWSVYDPSGCYYGICQWSKTYYGHIHGASLEEQLLYLSETLETTLNVYGVNYKNNFKYYDFCNLSCEKEAALAFAKAYERCSGNSYEIRKINAQKAYEYFTK